MGKEANAYEYDKNAVALGFNVAGHNCRSSNSNKSIDETQCTVLVFYA
jgi:hypothetical protein